MAKGFTTYRKPIPLYHLNLVVHDVSDCGEFFKAYPDMVPTFGTDRFDTYSAITHTKGKDLIVSVKGFLSHGSIAHEAKHVVNHVFVRIDQQLDRHNDEAECYLLGWIVNQIYEGLKHREKN